VADVWTTHLCPWLAEPYARLDRARREGHFSHAWLFAGPRGIGKTNLACALAGSVLNPSGGVPAELDARRAAEAAPVPPEQTDHHPDLHHLAPAIDKRSISVEQVREAIGALELTSLGGVAKVLVIEPAESMTLAAANALLKTLEEPTQNTYFFLVSHQPGLLPATIRSRCQMFPLAAPPVSAAIEWLSDGLEPAARKQLSALLGLAAGAPLRALGLSEAGYTNINKELEDVFQAISDESLDPQTVADQWLKRDPEILLDWLSIRLEWAIKNRLAPEAWTPVTDLDADSLHNTWRSLTLKALFECLQSTRALLAQVGGGVNLDLALRVLILGFQPGSRES
jgi:DNA polymerase-3 subunit delta'